MNWLYFLLGAAAVPCAIALLHFLAGRKRSRVAQAALQRAREKANARHAYSMAAKAEADFWATNSRKLP